MSAQWCSPRAEDVGRLSDCRYVERIRSRSRSMAGRSSWVMARSSDPEEDVQVAVGHGAVTADGPGVGSTERREHEAAGVELDERGQVGGVSWRVVKTVRAYADPGVSGVRAACDPDADLARLDLSRGDG